jgi:D-3-phosphoglycerate dehydrogenase
MPNVLCTPHLGASTEEAQSHVAVEAAELLIDFFSTGAIKSSVNMSPLDSKTLESLRGYLNLAHRLGLLLAQVSLAPPTRCTLKYQGDVAKKDCRLISAAFAAGLLEHAMESDVNIVNAELLLQERGIELIEQRSSDVGDFSSMITADVASEERVATASGTLFGNMPRLVKKGDFRLESRLEGVMLLFTHRDVPGVIGQIGTIFGKHRINIADMAVGRLTERGGGDAVGVLTVDSQPPPEALADIQALDPLENAWVVKLPPADQLPSWMAG